MTALASLLATTSPTAIGTPVGPAPVGVPAGGVTATGEDFLALLLAPVAPGTTEDIGEGTPADRQADADIGKDLPQGEGDLSWLTGAAATLAPVPLPVTSPENMRAIASSRIEAPQAGVVMALTTSIVVAGPVMAVGAPAQADRTPTKEVSAATMPTIPATADGSLVPAMTQRLEPVVPKGPITAAPTSPAVPAATAPTASGTAIARHTPDQVALQASSSVTLLSPRITTAPDNAVTTGLAASTPAVVPESPVTSTPAVVLPGSEPGSPAREQQKPVVVAARVGPLATNGPVTAIDISRIVDAKRRPASVGHSAAPVGTPNPASHPLVEITPAPRASNAVAQPLPVLAVAAAPTTIVRVAGNVHPQPLETPATSPATVPFAPTATSGAPTLDSAVAVGHPRTPASFAIAATMTSVVAPETLPSMPVRSASQPFAPAPRADVPVVPLPAAAPLQATAAQTFAEAIHRSLASAEQPGAGPGVGDVATPLVTAAPLAPVAAANTGQPSLDMGQHAWPEAMIAHIEKLRDMADANDTSIRLVPDALGTIDVSMRRDGDSVRVELKAEQAQTRSLIAEAQPRLQELAEQRGVKLQSGTASHGGGTGSQQQPAGGEPQRQPPRAPASVAPAPRRAAERHTDTDDRVA